MRAKRTLFKCTALVTVKTLPLYFCFFPDENRVRAEAHMFSGSGVFVFDQGFTCLLITEMEVFLNNPELYSRYT